MPAIRIPARVATATFAALTALSSLPATAQTLYRCGKTFSQTPCAIDAQPLKLHRGGDTAVPAEASTGAHACADAARAQLNLPPRHTLEIERAQAGKAEAIVYADQPMVARTFTVELTQMNGPVLVGTHTARCHLSEDGRRVLKLAL
jgi:hypothetical protein